jgi:hypothetical protein
VIGRAFVGLALGLAAAANAAADVFTFTPAKDNTIFAGEASLSNGAGDSLFAGSTASGIARRGLLQFDLSAIPAGSIVTGASLTLNVTRTPAGSQVSATALHRLLADWGEAGSAGGGGGDGAEPGDATWTYRFFNDPARVWTSLGGDFDPAASQTIDLVGGGPYTWTSSPRLVADVQGWIDDPAANFGWILIGDEAASSTAKRLDSREAITPEFRPLLTLEVTPIPEPSTYAMLVAGLGIVVVVARRRMR